MSAEHLILAGVFAILFVVPLAWLFLSDRARSGTAPLDRDPGAEPLPVAHAPASPD
ncbi:MAG: hypothetical protein ABW194_06225 [Novosphingobium sp.]